MEQREILLDLEEAFGRFLDEVSAMELIALGLMQMQVPWAGGVNAAYCHIKDSSVELKELLSALRSGK